MLTKNKDLLTSVKRTFVPIVVALLMSTFLGGYIPMAELQLLATAIVSTGYYVVARVAEKHVSPKFGFLLGAQSAPKYETKTEIESEKFMRCCCGGTECKVYRQVE